MNDVADRIVNLLKVINGRIDHSLSWGDLCGSLIDAFGSLGNTDGNEEIIHQLKGIRQKLGT